MIFGICKNKTSYKSDETIYSNYLVVDSDANYEFKFHECGTFEASKDVMHKYLNLVPDGSRLKEVITKIVKLDDFAKFKLVIASANSPLTTVEEVYLKLNALSQRLAKPRELNLDGAFGILKNLAWSGNVPYELEYLRENEIDLKLDDKYPNIDYVDKFPRYLHSIIPDDNTRILNSSNVRFGAYVSAGTTVMPGASYINFNAGTLGSSMVEGRISSSVIIGEGSDIGGGASILGVLSGTSGNPIGIGKNCLLGANSVTGIPLGDGCIVDAGIAVLEGSKIEMSDSDYAKLKEINSNLPKQDVYKGKELQLVNGAHFRIDSLKGKLIVKRSSKEIKLNKNLH